MQEKNNGFYTLLYFLVAIVPTIKQLWKNSKTAQPFVDEDLDKYCITRMLAPKDKRIEELLKSMGEGQAAYGNFEVPYFMEFVQLELKDFDVIYAFDRHYEIISWPDFDEVTAQTANCYVYSYDQRRENIRKLGKPALGLSPPFLS